MGRFTSKHGSVLLERLEDITDGDFQRMSTLDSQEFRNEFFSGSAELEEIGSSLSNDEISRLGRGGHDRRKVLAAYRAAEKSDRPAVILAHTVKGWGIESFTARNSTHQKKMMDRESLLAYRDHLGIEISDDMIEEDPFVKLSSDSPGLGICKLQALFPRRAIALSESITDGVRKCQSPRYSQNSTRVLRRTEGYQRRWFSCDCYAV